MLRLKTGGKVEKTDPRSLPNGLPPRTTTDRSAATEIRRLRELGLHVYFSYFAIRPRYTTLGVIVNRRRDKNRKTSTRKSYYIEQSTLLILTQYTIASCKEQN